MEQKDEGLKFPLIFNQCPNCGSERGLANEVLREEKAKGKIRPDPRTDRISYVTRDGQKPETG